jgi:hypothetical protein
MANVKVANDVRSLIADRVRSFKPMEFIAGPSIDEMSPRTILEDVEVFDDEIMFFGDKFRGAINVYLTLNYENGKNGGWASASFPGSFTGFLRGAEPVVENVTVDTSSFCG